MPARISDLERTALLRAELRKIRAERFDGNLSAMARDLKVTPAYLSDALSEKRGIGMKLIHALARFTGRTIDDLVGAPTVATAGRWNALPWWPGVIAEARTLFPTTSDDAWQWLGSLGCAEPPRDAMALGSMATALDQARARHGAAIPPSAEPKSKPKARRSA